MDRTKKLRQIWQQPEGALLIRRYKANHYLILKLHGSYQHLGPCDKDGKPRTPFFSRKYRTMKPTIKS